VALLPDLAPVSYQPNAGDSWPSFTSAFTVTAILLNADDPPARHDYLPALSTIITALALMPHPSDE
jgi:hypothetical protein